MLHFFVTDTTIPVARERALFSLGRLSGASEISDQTTREVLVPATIRQLWSILVAQYQGFSLVPINESLLFSDAAAERERFLKWIAESNWADGRVVANGIIRALPRYKPIWPFGIKLGENSLESVINLERKNLQKKLSLKRSCCQMQPQSCLKWATSKTQLTGTS
jgi:hypothetical protein